MWSILCEELRVSNSQAEFEGRRIAPMQWDVELNAFVVEASHTHVRKEERTLLDGAHRIYSRRWDRRWRIRFDVH